MNNKKIGGGRGESEEAPAEEEPVVPKAIDSKQDNKTLHQIIHDTKESIGTCITDIDNSENNSNSQKTPEELISDSQALISNCFLDDIVSQLKTNDVKDANEVVGKIEELLKKLLKKTQPHEIEKNVDELISLGQQIKTPSLKTDFLNNLQGLLDKLDLQQHGKIAVLVQMKLILMRRRRRHL